jgi:hypothetical protein
VAVPAAPLPAGAGFPSAPPAQYGAYPTAQPTGMAAAPYAFTVGRFLGGVFTTWGRAAGWIIPFALVAYAPAAVAMYRLYANLSEEALRTPDPFSYMASFGIVFAAIVLLTPIERAAIARAGVRRLQEEPVGFGDMLATALRFYFPTFGLLFLVGLAFLGTACTLFIVPAILLTAWSASLPAMITEGLGPIEALKRSWKLTKGLRWQLFAGFLVVALVLGAVACMLQGLLSALVIGAAVGAGGRDPQRLMGTMSVMQAANMLLQGVYTSVYTVATAVAYHQLRVATEGPGAQHLEKVFE